MSDPQTIQSLLAGRALTGAGSAPGATDASKVKELAVQFESMLLSQMLKGLQTSMVDGEDSPDGFKAGPLGDVMTQELGLALGRAGGFGLSSMLTGALGREAGLTPASPSDPPTSASLLAGFAQSLGVPVGVQSAGSDDAGALDTSATALATLTAPAPRVSSNFGWRDDPIDGGAKFHKGVDLPMPVGSAVLAPADGRVTSVGDQPGYGLTVVVAHGNGLESRYAHLSGTDVRPGDNVRAGQVIAQSGNTGRSTGPHLHFELTVNGEAIDPTGWAGAVASRSPGAGQ